MCKAFAAAGRFDELAPLERSNLHKFLTNLYLSSSTDQDATGVFAWSGDRSIHSRPAARAAEFVEKDDKWASLEHNPAKLYLCHLRGAMSPTTPEDNNHPFVGNNVALMHVGWISNHWKIAMYRNLELVSTTDTELYMRIADARRKPIGSRKEWDPIRTMKHMMSLTHEPTALAFIDHSSKNPAIYFSRNRQSLHPFAFYYIPRFNGVFLAATSEMMDIAGILSFDNPEEEIVKIADADAYSTYKMKWNSSSVVQFDRSIF